MVISEEEFHRKTDSRTNRRFDLFFLRDGEAYPK